MRQGLADVNGQSTAGSRLLPVEIGFLAHHGHSPEMLHEASMLASLTGVPVDQFLIKGGHIREAAFYRALATELLLPFTSMPRLAAGTRYPDSILAGIAPSAAPSGGLVIAPQGASLAWLLRRRHGPAGMLTVTTPSLLARAVFRHRRGQIAHRCANGLPDRAPHLSGRDGATTGQIAALSAAAALLSFGGHLAPEIALACLGAALSPLFLGMSVMRLAASILGAPVKPATEVPRADDRSLPVYTIIVALYREKRIASRLIEVLACLDYPAAKLDIKLVLEADDTETPTALASARLPAFVEVIVAPPGAFRGRSLARSTSPCRWLEAASQSSTMPRMCRTGISCALRWPPSAACPPMWLASRRD